jgi:hypothetical protein
VETDGLTVDALISSTKALIQRDPEQEVRGDGLVVADAAISAVRGAIPDDPVVAAASSSDTVAASHSTMTS